MFDTVVIATDGSESAARAVEVALDFARRFDAAVHALYVVDEREVAASPEAIRKDLASALEATAEDALAAVRERTNRNVQTAVREGRPASEIIQYADAIDADLVAVGTRGRGGDHGYLLGSVAERVVRTCSRPVLTIRQIDEPGTETAAG